MEIRLLEIGFGLFLKVENTKKNIFLENRTEIRKYMKSKNKLNLKIE